MVTMAVLWGIKSYNKTSIAFPVMLVFICVIRKGIECIFSHQELRALDDLLPGRKSEKRKLGYKNTGRPSGTVDVEEMEEMSLVLKKKRKERGGSYLDTELEELMSQEAKPSRYKKVPSAANVRVAPRVEKPGEKVLIFLRLKEDEVFLPVHLSPVTFSNLINTIRNRFPPLKNKKVVFIMFNVEKFYSNLF